MNTAKWADIYRRSLRIGNEGQRRRKLERLRREFTRMTGVSGPVSDEFRARYFALEKIIAENHLTTELGGVSS